MRLREFPPALPPGVFGYPLNGGRVISITIHPTEESRIVVATEFGGLWRTDDGGARWRPIPSLRALWARDVSYDNEGERLVATVLRDNAVTNGGGIWMTRDDGRPWTRSPSSVPPADPRVPARGSAYGISFSPDDGSLYVGTDYGVAFSRDGGATWTHRMVESTSPVAWHLLQNAACSVLALPEGRVIALTRTGVYRSDDAGESWIPIRSGDFAFQGSHNNIDVSPIDDDKVFILESYTRLWLYEVDAGLWTPLPLPDGTSRGPFVHAARSHTAGDRIDLWVGTGFWLRRLVGRTIAGIKSAAASDWVSLGTAEGLHVDAGCLATNGDGYPALYGDDGGLFRPANRDATSWEHAATAAGGWNSYQITDIAATNVPRASGGYDTTLYFSTQDNSIWASPDGGTTWPRSDCTEGFHIEVRKDAPSDADVTVAYGCPGASVFADAGLVRPRPVPNVDTAGRPQDGMGQAFFISPGQWIRGRFVRGGVPEVWVSQNNGNNWSKRADVQLEWRGVPAVSGSGAATVMVLPVRGTTRTADGREKIGIVQLSDLFATTVRTLSEADVTYLPDDGSLGLRATMFDWQAVIGVDPADPRFIIAPDIHNGGIRITRDGGADGWPIDRTLTDLVTDNGALLLWDESPYQIEVTHISFDPYRSNRIFVGTRESGVIYTTDRGRTWRRVDGSERALYVTGFAFKRDSTVVMSTYGRGLWTLDDRRVKAPFPRRRFCRRPCRYRRAPDPRPVRPPRLGSRQVILALDGSISGVRTRKGAVISVSMTPGSTYRHYAPKGDQLTIDVDDSGTTSRLGHIKACREAIRLGEHVLALVLSNDGELVGVFSSPEERSSDLWRDEEVDEDHVEDDDTPVPYLFLTTDIPMPSLPAVGDEGTVHVHAINFIPDADPPKLLLDGKELSNRLKVSRDGTVRSRFKTREDLQEGSHVVEVVQEVKKRRLVARSTFVKTFEDELEDDSQDRR